MSRVYLPHWWNISAVNAENTFRGILGSRLPSDKVQLVLRALELAHKAHEGQQRKGGGAYIVHPIRIALSLLLECRINSPDMLAAALLHDVIEDAKGNFESGIEQCSSLQVLRLVRAVTRKKEEKRPREGDLSLDTPYFKRIREAGYEAIILKLADKLDNLRDALNHPDLSKRAIYVAETYHTYLLLLDDLPPSCSQEAGYLREALLQALDNHACSGGPSHAAALFSALRDKIGTMVAGTGVTMDFPAFRKPLERYLLLNPALDCWLTSDGTYAVKTEPSPLALAGNVALALSDLIAEGRASELIQMAGLPSSISAANDHWNRVSAQLRELARLFGEREQDLPCWIRPLAQTETPECALLVVHSRLLAAASWLFPMWLPDYGASLVGAAVDAWGNVFGSAIPDSVLERWKDALGFLLADREAVMRYRTGLGTQKRLLKVCRTATSVAIAPEQLWSMRVLTEYLDAMSHTNAPGTMLDTLWQEWLAPAGFFLGKESVPAVPSMGGDDTFLPKLRKTGALPIELSGYRETRHWFCERGAGNWFAEFCSRLLISSELTAGQDESWLYFDAEEFRKREELFSECDRCEAVAVSANVENLEDAGFHVTTFSEGGRMVCHVRPARKFALMNRLPELSHGQIDAIASKDLTAVGMFDVMLKELDSEHAYTGHEKQGGAAVWLPRVYRILDTLEDLDPAHVQKISVFLDLVGEQVQPFVAYLPLPCDEKEMVNQNWRKEIVARYIVTQSYNCAVTRRIRGVTVECAPHPHPAAFTNEELRKLVAQTEREYGFRKGYGEFVECFNYNPFELEVTTPPPADERFDRDDMTWGTFFGIDIGGTGTKFGLARYGKALGKVSGIPTFESAKPPIPLEIFCESLIKEATEKLKTEGLTWSDLDGAGISWAGAVRDPHLAGVSGNLTKLTVDGRSFTYDQNKTPPPTVYAIDLPGILRKLIEEEAAPSGGLRESFALALVNDGDSEAYGNFCDRVLAHKRQGGKATIVIKLGTSVAGGRIDSSGVLAPDITELGKLVLNLNVGQSGYPTGNAREFVSSVAVRNLSRYFVFRGDEPLFGNRNNENTEEAKETRIESIELGHLLDLWQAFSRQEKEMCSQIETFVTELVGNNNLDAPMSYSGILSALTADLAAGARSGGGGEVVSALGSYIRARGHEKAPINSDSTTGWKFGLERTHWLATGEHRTYSEVTDGLVPSDFPFAELAAKVLGTVALFSQLGLQIAHTLAELYNIYRRDGFGEVILAGGVLGGATGRLVCDQTQAFMLAYYDKICKHLNPNNIVLAKADDPEMMGPLGAAMVANRKHKATTLSLLRRAVRREIAGLPPSGAVSVSGLTDRLEALTSRFSRPILEGFVRSWLSEHVRDTELLPGSDQDVFIRR